MSTTSSGPSSVKRKKHRPQTNAATDEVVTDQPLDTRHKLVPDDFKIVFISSDSSKESELNSSMEGASSNSENVAVVEKPNKKKLKKIKVEKSEAGEYIEETDMNWSQDHFVAASSPKIKLPPKTRHLQFMGDDAPYRIGYSSPSVVSTIRTAATRDINSPLRTSPRTPKVHKIPVEVHEDRRKKFEHRFKTFKKVGKEGTRTIEAHMELQDGKAVLDRSLGEDLSIHDQIARDDLYRSMLFTHIDGDGAGLLSR